MPALIEIVQAPEIENQRSQHVLYVPSARVLSFDDKLQSILEDMIATMHHEQGIGIAAPQVGIGLQIFIIEANLDNIRYPHLKKYPEIKSVAQQIFINPKITKASTECIAYWHGCLSAKGAKRGLLRTYKTINFSAQDREGNTIAGSLSGLSSIIFQHELRHLLGSLYTDHAKELLTLDSLQEDIRNGKRDLYSETPNKGTPHMLNDYLVGESVDEYKRRKKL